MFLEFIPVANWALLKDVNTNVCDNSFTAQIRLPRLIKSSPNVQLRGNWTFELFKTVNSEP